MVSCEECDRLTLEEMNLTRSAADADVRLQEFSPEPPFGEDARREFRDREVRAEDARAALLRVRKERVAHGNSHWLSVRS